MTGREFSLKSFGLAYNPASDFAQSSWFSVPFVIAYRATLAVFCTAWMIYIVVDSDHKTFIYLTNWSYAALSAYFVTATAITSFYYVRARRGQQHTPLIAREDGGERGGSERNGGEKDGLSTCDDDTVWYHKVMWVLYNIASNMALGVTITFWLLEYDGKGVSVSDIMVHILNSVFMVFENAVCSMPLRLLHAIYPFIFSLMWTLCTVVYWLCGGSPIYAVLDYTNNPWLAIGVNCFSLFISIPVAQLFLYILYKSRCYLSKKSVITA